MPKELEAVLESLNAAIAVVRAHECDCAAKLLEMACLELKLRAANITDEEFRAALNHFESQSELESSVRTVKH